MVEPGVAHDVTHGAAGARLGVPRPEDQAREPGQHDGTGGAVTVDTVTAQLLYEVGDGRYAGPDVTTRLDTVALTDDGPDRVLISGVRGEAPPPDLKVSCTSFGGFRNEVTMVLTGLDIEEKAALVEAAFWEALPYSPDDYASVSTRLVRTDTDARLRLVGDGPQREALTARATELGISDRVDLVGAVAPDWSCRLVLVSVGGATDNGTGRIRASVLHNGPDACGHRRGSVGSTRGPWNR